MATMRRLSDDDVRAIFESLHGNYPPPPHLNFKIVPVNCNGLRLSPPSYEFDDGLYVLLRPEKKRKKQLSNGDVDWRSKVPSQLTHLVLTDSLSETCPWSLSGPQFPQPTAIQQRYCYPKGNPEYSGRKGGALWTMYNRDGKEDLEFRLLHVYFSVKRASNKGVTLTEEDRLKQEEEARTPKKKRPRVNRAIRSPWQERKSSGVHQTFHRRGSPPGSSSPPYVDRLAVLPPPSPYQSDRHVFGVEGSVFVSPNTAASSSETASHGPKDHIMFEHSLFHPVPSFDNGTKVLSHNGPSPFREMLEQREPYRSEAHIRNSLESNDSFEFNEAAATVLGGTAGNLESVYWNDPLFTLSNKPSFEENESPKVPAASPKGSTSSADSLRVRLHELHQRIRDGVLAHPPQDQGPLLCIIATWARKIAMSPLRVGEVGKDAELSKSSKSAPVSGQKIAV